MSQQRSPKRSLSDSSLTGNSLKECNSTPYKRRKQTGQALEALSQLFTDSFTDDHETNKLNKNDILSLTLSRLLRCKYWSSNVINRNVQLTAGIQSTSITDDLTGFIVVVNISGRIILLSDNIEYYLRKNVRSLYPQLTSIYDCVSKDDHDTIHQMLSTPTMTEKRAICNWILPRGKRPNRSHTETKSMLLTGHYFFIENEPSEEPLFIIRCEQILSSIPNIPTNSIGSTSTTTLRFVLTDQLKIAEISPNVEGILGCSAEDLIDQSISRIIPEECLPILEQAKQNCLVGEHCTSMNVLDLFTHHGDRLTFLCNTHMLVEGRRKSMKFGFLAQLIDPSVRYECLSYANKQNIERHRATVQQESVFITNMVLNNSTATNVFMPLNDQPLSMYKSSKLKRQPVEYEAIEKENCLFYEPIPPVGEISFESNIFSPTNQPEHMDELFKWLDEETNKISPHDSSFNDLYEIDLGLITPIVTEIDFF